jgi:hypothetical protein
MALSTIAARLVAAGLGIGLAGCFAGAALAHGGGGGGGGHGGGHVVVTGGYYRGGYYIIPGAAMPLELLDSAPTAMEGALTPGVVVAQHTVRVAEARVLTEDFTEKQGILIKVGWPMPTGTVLAKVVLYSNPKHELWCQLPKPIKPQGESTFECLADEGHTGAFTKLWFGTSSNRFLGVSFSTANEGKTLDKPLAYRAATVEERPIARIGYRWCDGDAVKTPPRFALATRFDDDPDWIGGGASWCDTGTWTNPSDHAHVDVFGLKLTVAPRADQGLDYKVEGRIPAAALLANFRRGFPPRAEGAAITPVEVQIVMPMVLGEHPYERVDPAPTHADGKIAEGGVLATFAVKRKPTGVLLNRIVLDPKEANSDALEIGQPMFGYEQKTTVGQAEMVWCAPRLQPDKHWVTWCINGEAQAIRARAAFFPSPGDVLGFGAGVRSVASVASVKLQPVDFPTIRATMKYSSGDDGPGAVAIFDDWGEGEKRIETQTVMFDAHGVARVQVPDGVMILHRIAAFDGRPSETTVAFEPAPPPPPRGPVLTPVAPPPLSLPPTAPAAAAGP